MGEAATSRGTNSRRQASHVSDTAYLIGPTGRAEKSNINASRFDCENGPTGQYSSREQKDTPSTPHTRVPGLDLDGHANMRYGTQNVFWSRAAEA